MMGRFKRSIGLWAALGVIIGPAGPAGPAVAQRLPGLGGLPNLSLPTATGVLPGDLDAAAQAASAQADRLARPRLDKLASLVRDNPRVLEFDDRGGAVVRGEVLAIDPSSAALDNAVKAGFAVLRSAELDPLGIRVVTLAAPSGMTAGAALKRARSLDPSGRYDLDHIYTPSGAMEAAPAALAGVAPGSAGTATVGLLDTGVAVDQASIASSLIDQRGFAPGGVKPGAHGTAVASLMIGREPGFEGAAPGARLLAADVYGSGPTGGSVDDIVRALAWMARERVPVINISLVGPPNLTLEAAVRALVDRGQLIVAPVGNDGPAAPPLYPACYRGVVAVTGVDARGRVLLEAGRCAQIAFAAPGADILAAKPGGGLIAVRGTSFAAPIVSGRLSMLMPRVGPREAAEALASLARSAALNQPKGAVVSEILVVDMERFSRSARP